MGRLRAPVAAGLATLAVACVLFPWWRAGGTPVLLVDGPPAPLAADAWTGVELLGAPPSIGLAVLAAVGLGLPDRWALPVAGLVGGATAASAGRVLAAWGPGATPGLWAAVVLGVTAVGLAVGRPRVGAVPVVAAALVGGLAAGLLPATGTAAADGPFVRLADLADGGPLRSGATALPASDLRLTLIDGSAAAVTADGIATFGHGHVDVVARVPADDRVRHAGGILGVAGDRVARFVAPGTLLVTGLRPGDPTAVRVRGVAEASAVGSGRHGVAARLRRARRRRPPPRPARLPRRGHARRHRAARRHGRRAGRGGPARRRRPAAGARRCAAPHREQAGTRDGRAGPHRRHPARGRPRPGLRAHRRGPQRDAGRARPVRTHPGRRRLAGGERAAPARRTGRRAAGGPGAAARGRRRAGHDAGRRPRRRDAAGRCGRWPPNAPLEDLPPTRSDCVPDPPPAGPPATLVPITNTGTDRLGAPLGVDGRWASSTRDGQISTVSADGRTRVPLGGRQDAAPSPVWPDGAGGVWWLEGTTPVHARPARPETRLPPVPLPASPMSLVPDLGDRPPLVATPQGAYRLDGTRLVDGPVTGGVVRADGRGWLLAGGRVLALADGRVLGPVIEGTGPAAPVPVQLAKGVPARPARARRRVARARRAGPGGGARRRGRARDHDGRRGAPGGAGPAADRVDHRRGRPRAARRQRRAAAGGAAGLGLPQPQAARTRLPAVVTRRSVVASTITMAIAHATTTAAGGVLSAMPISAQTTAAA